MIGRARSISIERVSSRFRLVRSTAGFNAERMSFLEIARSEARTWWGRGAVAGASSTAPIRDRADARWISRVARTSLFTKRHTRAMWRARRPSAGTRQPKRRRELLRMQASAGSFLRTSVRAISMSSRWSPKHGESSRELTLLRISWRFRFTTESTENTERSLCDLCALCGDKSLRPSEDEAIRGHLELQPTRLLLHKTSQPGSFLGCCAIEAKSLHPHRHEKDRLDRARCRQSRQVDQ